MKIQILLPIKEPRDIIISQARSYLIKLRPPLHAEINFLALKKISHQSQDLLDKSANTYRIALTETGTKYTSIKFSNYLEKLKLRQKKISFIIGDSQGLPSKLVSQADNTISLSDFTLPHRIALLVLCEQLYRSSEIANNTPYHK